MIKPFRPSELTARVRTHIRLASQAKELKASIQELDQFCHTVSHDLKSPIMVIRQLAAALVDSVPEESREQVRIPARLLDQKCSQTIAMIERLLEFSRMTKLDFHRETVSPEALFIQVFQELRSLEPERSIRFHCDPMPMIQADPTLFRLLAQNLIGNALKFTRRRETAKISITWENIRSGLSITIADNGAGFDMAYSDRLFHVFERLHSASDFEGSGVGLAICARIMKTHGGSVSITGEPDHGCKVTLWFPLLKTGKGTPENSSVI